MTKRTTQNKNASKRARKNKAMAKVIVVIGALALLLSSGLAYFGWSQAVPGQNDQQSPSNINNMISYLEKQAEQYQDSLEKAPDNVYLLTELGNTYFGLGQTHEERGRLYKDDTATAKSAENFAKAVEFYGKALTLKPDDVNVRVDRATAAFYSTNYEVAEEEYKKAIELDPTHVRAYFNYGIFLYWGKNDFPEAITQWEKLIALNPENEQEIMSMTRSYIAQAKAGLMKPEDSTPESPEQEQPEDEAETKN